MKTQMLYSIRMQATVDDRHASGAERIVPEEQVDAAVNGLIVRALEKKCRPERINVIVDRLPASPIRKLVPLDLVLTPLRDVPRARAAAMDILERIGIAGRAARKALALLEQGPASSGNNMRGGMIIDGETGKRLEPDRERGVRATRFDWSDDALKRTKRLFAGKGLTHIRTREAIALATKVAHAPGIIAELCWSDDPEYEAGYVASPRTGYIRFPRMKRRGDARGGRAFFVRHDHFDREAFISFLQETPALIIDAPRCRDAADDPLLTI